MNRLTHRQALAGGLAIILAVNAIALAGVAWNRGARESQLALTERELPTAWRGSLAEDEDSGVALRLDYEVPERDRIRTPYDGGPAWLDTRKLAALGFDLRLPRNAADRDYSNRPQEREVLLVLELAGPAYVHKLEQVQASLRERLSEFARPGASAGQRQEAREAVRDRIRLLRNAAHRDSRLFAIDAGLDREALRKRYPDRSRYALVPALVQMYWHTEDHRTVAQGSINGLVNERINVASSDAQRLGLRTKWRYALPDGSPDPPLDVELAFGRRLEPWILSMRPRAVPK